MNGATSRTERLIGPARFAALAAARVAVFGVGGVGSFAVEALARAGVRSFLLVDADVVEPSNLNRQLVALASTLGARKVDVMAARVRDIAPAAVVDVRAEFYSSANAATFVLASATVVVDAIDSVPAKAELLARAAAAGVPVASAMGAANRMDPTAFRVVDLAETSGDGLARALRSELRARGLDLHGPCVLSSEPPAKLVPPGSLVTVTAAAGLILAQAALDLIWEKSK